MKQYSCEIISCLRRMICCSCHTPTITFIMKKAQMTSRKGPTTPLEGVWWGLWGLSIAWSPMLLSFWWWCLKPIYLYIVQSEAASSACQKFFKKNNGNNKVQRKTNTNTTYHILIPQRKNSHPIWRFTFQFFDVHQQILYSYIHTLLNTNKSKNI